MNRLELLDCSETQVSSLLPLKELCGLIILNCKSTNILNLDPIAGFKQLTNLNCENTGVSDLTPLEKLVQLVELELKNTQIFNLDPIQELYRLERLRIYVACLAAYNNGYLHGQWIEDADILRIQAFCLAETLALDSSEVEAIGLLTKPDFAAYWSPDDAFFDILRDKPTINAMVKEIAGKSVADSCVSDTAKQQKQKQIIKNRIAGHGVPEPDSKWRPKWASFPALAYKAVDGCPPAQRARRIAKLFK